MGRRNINNLCYDDNATLIIENVNDLQTVVLKVKEHSGKTGLQLNIKKTSGKRAGMAGSLRN